MKVYSMVSRYAFAACVLAYMAAILALHAAGLFPRPGLYDVSHLIGLPQVTFDGEVVDFPVLRWNQTRFVFDGAACPMNGFHGKCVVTLTFLEPELASGDRIRLRGWLSAPRAASSPQDFDERGYWANRRVFTMLKVWSPESLTVLRRSSPWSLSRQAWKFHGCFRRFWERVLPPDEASLLLGMSIGARGILPRRIKEACIRAGVYHIVVVSGQNMSLIVVLGVSVLLMLQIPRRHALWICAAPILFYCASVGGDPPVTRAAASALFGLAAAALARDPPRFYPLLWAAAWILAWEPEAMLGASFQLSFGAVLSILVIFPILAGQRRRNGGWRWWMKEVGLMGIAVHIGIWPLLVFYFHRLSFVGLVANWTIFPLSAVLMIFGLGVGTWGVVAPSTVPSILLRAIAASVKGTLKLIEAMGRSPHAVVTVPPPAGWIYGLYYGILFGILFVFHRRRIYAQTQFPISSDRPRLQRGQTSGAS
jgi:competence protein ComEC